MAKKDDQEKDYGKRIIMLIIIILIILLLITSCSCTSNFFGRLGSSLSDSIGNLFNHEEEIDIDDNTDGKETVTNRELKFDTSEIEVGLEEDNVKLSFSYDTINPKTFTCVTSDASIATCYVEDGYVVIKPKKVGTTTITLSTVVNGKNYQAKASVKVTDIEKYIYLSNNRGVINLKEKKTAYIYYYLSGIEGTLNLTSSNPKVAVATLVGFNTIRITAFKAGATTITLSVNYNGKTYKDTYQLSVVSMDKPNKPGTGSNGDLGGTDEGSDLGGGETGDNGGDNGNNPTNPDNPSNPTDPTKPDKPTDPTEPDTPEEPSESDKNNYLASLTVSSPYSLDQEFDKTREQYAIIVGDNEKNLSLVAVPESDTSTLTCTLNGKTLKNCNLNNLKLEGGWNQLNITVNPKVGDSRTYEVEIYMPSYNYYLDVMNDIYHIGFLNTNSAEKSFIVYTNIFKESDKVVNTSSDSKKIEICSSNRNYCLELAVDNSGDNANLTLDYLNEDTTTSLAFKATAASIGTSKIHVVGTVFGKTVGEVDIIMDSVAKYVLSLKANGGVYNTGGLFTEIEDEYEFLLEAGEDLDLSPYTEPYLLDEDTCTVYDFLGYGDKDSNLLYDVTKKNTDYYVVHNIQSNMTLYAIYDTSAGAEKKEEITRKLWLTDAEIFYNKEIYNNEYFQNRGETKVIYPGVPGVYKMIFENKSSNAITITGMSLKEDTICVPNKGCINMGYIMKYSDTLDDNWTYYYGDVNDTYWHIWKRKSSLANITNYNQSFKEEMKFGTDKTIKVEPGDSIIISLFWKWVDYNTKEMNKLDTEIGNYVALKNVNVIDDMYKLSIGLEYKTKIECD